MTLSVDQILQQGIEAQKAGQVQDAERLYLSILQEQPDHPDAHHNLGALALSAGAPKSALHHFQIALETKPEQAQYWLSMIDTLITVGQTDDAWKILQQGRDLGLTGEKFDQLERQLKAKQQLPEQDQVNALIALYNQGRLEEVIEQTNALVEQFPQAILLFNISGAANAGLRRFDAAIDSYNCALLIEPDNIEVHNNLGNTLKEKGDLAAAIDSYHRALQIQPSYAAAHYNLGTALQEIGELTAAIESYDRALVIQPDFADALNNRGNVLKDKGDLTEAIESYNRALQMKPDIADVHYNLGNALKDRGDLTEAIGSYNRTLQIRPDHGEAYSNLGIVLVGKDDLKAAIDVYTDGLKIDPENLKFKRALGSALLKIGEHERGLRFQIAGSGVIRFDIKSGVTINLGEGV